MKQNYTLEELEAAMKQNDWIVERILLGLVVLLVAGIMWL